MKTKVTYKIVKLNGEYHTTVEGESFPYTRKTLVDEIGQTAVTMLNESIEASGCGAGKITIIVED